MNSFIREQIERAKKGDLKAARAVLEQFVGLAFAGKADSEVQEYMAYCINDILDGEDVQKALNIKKPNTKPKKDEDKETEIAVLIEMEVRLNKANKAKAPVQIAIETIAERIGKEYDTVREIRNKYGAIANLIADRKLRK